MDCILEKKKKSKQNEGLSLVFPNTHQKKYLLDQNVLATLFHNIEINFPCTHNQSYKVVLFYGTMSKASSAVFIPGAASCFRNDQRVLSDGALGRVGAHTIPHCSSCVLHEEGVDVALQANTEVPEIRKRKKRRIKIMHPFV